MKVYLLETNADRQVILAENKSMYICPITSGGLLAGTSIDIFAEDVGVVMQQLKEYFTTEPMNDFSELNPKLPFKFIDYDFCGDPDSPRLIFICNVPSVAGWKLQQLRLERGYTVERLVELTGFPIRTIESWLGGKRQLKDIAKIKALAAALDVDYRAFI